MTIALALLATALAAQATEARPQLKCDRGGVARTLGGSDWIAYGCDDGQSVALVTTASGPTPPLHLFVLPSGDSYSVSGDETTSAAAVASAKDALIALGTDGLRALALSAQGGQKPR